MVIRRTFPVVGPALFVIVAGTLAACSTTTVTMPGGPGRMDATSSTGSGMMGGSRSTMMNGDGGYHFAPLSCAEPAGLPASTVRVTLADMGMTRNVTGTAPVGAHMMLRADRVSIPAGQIVLVATNRGWRTHEVVVLPLAAGQVAGQRTSGSDGKVDESGSIGELSASCAAGTGEGITPSAVGWTTLTLAAGRYELVCNMANHYVDGMYEELDVV
jgi:uncharacterized cupredoxin-like copper-binding protein